jgi:hypothetical protein
LFFQTRKIVKNFKWILERHSGGVFKRIDENRELLELLRKDAPELLTKQPWIESWLRSQDDFLNELAAQVPLAHAQFAPTPLGYPGHQFPRPLPALVKPCRSRPIKEDK